MGRLSAWCAALIFASIGIHFTQESHGQTKDPGFKVIDLSLLVAPDLPCTWAAGNPPFQINHYLKIGPHSAYNSDILTIDEHTGTQLDAPAHFIPPPGSGLPNAGPFNKMTADKLPAWQLCGEACVVDCRDLLDTAPKGRSDLVTKERIQAWEKKHRPLGFGDVVLFRSDFADKYYKPFPAGRGFVANPLGATSPGWPDPDPACVEYLASRKVMNLGTDSPSMGPIPDLAVATHVAGLKHGMCWTEGCIGLGQLPTTGAFYCMMGPKHAKSSGFEGRAFAIVAASLSNTLIKSVQEKKAWDLSVTMADDLPVWWPGAGLGYHRCPYYSKVFHTWDQVGGPYFSQTHTLDSHTGTHLVPPAFALPKKGFNNKNYSKEVQEWLTEYDAKYGPRGTSDVTTERVPLGQTCGFARIIDVKHLVGTTDKKVWPASPEITVAHIQDFEKKSGPFKPGDIVIFSSGWTDKHVRPFPAGDSCMADPLNGKSEGWPAPGPDAIQYLAEKGIRCVATDAPSLGGVDAKRALWTYWMLGTKGIAGVEFLTGISQVQGPAFFLFAPVYIRDCHGGPGRAIAVGL
ncbi:MAG: cyclase family protein [Gemmataceae bacterium]|nr:cyclase family protein [Gemmataceae bacterium]